MKMVKEIKSILKEFCNWSGKKMNVQKYVIIFEKLVNRRRRKSISKIMRFITIKEMSYLGVKIVVRKLVSANIHNIFDKTLGKIKVWGNKFIS